MIIFQIAIIKTIYYNFKLFKISDAIRFPLIIGKKTKVNLKRGDLSIKSNIRLGMISFGIGGSKDLYYFESHKNFLGVNNGGKIIFRGKAHFAIHTSCFASGGTIVFGDRFSSNVGCKISAVNRIEFGRECLLGGKVVVRDSDGHMVFDLTQSGERNYHSVNKPVVIGNHVWIGNESVLLKGVTIGDGCIVAYGSIIPKSILLKNCIIGGVPGKILKKNVSWER